MTQCPVHRRKIHLTIYEITKRKVSCEKMIFTKEIVIARWTEEGKKSLVMNVVKTMKS